jgi:hypothetical protein
MIGYQWNRLVLRIHEHSADLARREETSDIVLDGHSLVEAAVLLAPMLRDLDVPQQNQDRYRKADRHRKENEADVTDESQRIVLAHLKTRQTQAKNETCFDRFPRF